ncbi:MAG: hydroxymethylbilane synthase, partial [Archaeoglobaceae archaeon]
MKLRIGTRGSKLALAQTKIVAEKLEKEGYEVEIRIIKTAGDIMKDRPLHEFKGMGA